MRAAVARVTTVDQRLFRRIAQADAPALDVPMRRLTTAADHSKLWFGVSAALWASRDRFARRAALRGLLSLGAASAVTNIAAKRAARRSRPSVDLLSPLRLHRVRYPSSTSFPSGHAASAAAFATGASLEEPRLAVPLGALAGAVGYSRVHVGVHYPGDVLVGALIGGGLALAGRRVWPVAPHDPAQARPSARATSVEPAPSGAGVTIAVNRLAGSASGTADQLREHLPEASVVEVEDGEELTAVLRRAADDAVALGVAGGDGTINCAAQVATDSGKPLAVVPSGTLNHFARDLGIGSLEDAVSAVRSGSTVAVDVAAIDDRVFVNTASFGSYVDLVDARVRLERRIGKWPAVAVAVVQVLRGARPVRVELDGRRTDVWMIFIGNCAYHPTGLAPSWRERLDDGQLDVRVVDGTQPWARVRLVVSALTGTLASSGVFRRYTTRELHVRSLEGPLRLARDGETFDGGEEFTVRKCDRPLTLYAPEPADP